MADDFQKIPRRRFAKNINNYYMIIHRFCVFSSSAELRISVDYKGATDDRTKIKSVGLVFVIKSKKLTHKILLGNTFLIVYVINRAVSYYSK